MNLHADSARRTAAAFAVGAAAAGLILTGCGKNNPSAAVGSTSAAATSAATSAAATGGASAGSSAAATSSASQSSAVTSSGSLPFPDTVGDSWKYNDSNGTTTENTVTAATPVATGTQVAMADAFKSTDGTTTHSTFDYIVQPNGQIALPTGQFTSGLANTGASIKVVSGGIFWPSAAQLASGQPVHTTLVMALDISGVRQTITEHITSQGDGTQTVTVPAGTYNASVVSVSETAKVMGYSIDIDQKTWLASGVGPVQSEIISVDGSKTDVSNKEQLVSFTKG